MSEIICIANQKGGVGKTTTAVNLAAALAHLEKRVLLLDIDPQSNATTSLGIGRNQREFSIFHLLNGSHSFEEVVCSEVFDNLDLVPSSIGLAVIEKEFYAPKRRNSELVLRNRLKDISDNYDYIIIDSPPALGPLTINALSASTSVIIPVQCEFFALEGVAQLVSTISLIKKSINPALYTKGFLPTMHTTQNNLSKQVLLELENHFGKLLFKDEKGELVVVPRNVKIAESPSFGMPISHFAPSSKGAIAYRELAKCIIRG